MRRSGTGIRMVILDDNPFLRGPDGAIRPKAATFHDFAAAVIAAGPFQTPATYLAPVTDTPVTPPTTPVDDRLLEVVRTEPFDGAADYLRRLPLVARRNWPIIRSAIAAADLLWIKAPASNALMAALAASRVRAPRFVWVAGSATAVVRTRPGSIVRRMAAVSAAGAYDGIARLLTWTSPAIRLDEDLFASVIRDSDIAATRSRPSSADVPPRIVWAGRMTEEKGLDTLIRAIRPIAEAIPMLQVRLVGDGPSRPSLERLASATGMADRVEWTGQMATTQDVLRQLRGSSVFVLPSRSEGVPKVLVEAMAAGSAIVATDVGGVRDVLGHGERGVLIPSDDVRALASAVTILLEDQDRRGRLAAAGIGWAAEHTRERQADRLVGWLRREFGSLSWPETDPSRRSSLADARRVSGW